LLGVPLSGLLITLCVVMLAGWLPHYLTWPWWADLDTLATIAQGWDAGIRPYRDVALFNFPGQIELFWLLEVFRLGADRTHLRRGRSASGGAWPGDVGLVTPQFRSQLPGAGRFRRISALLLGP